MKQEILVDARGLEPPEPLELVLDALDRLEAGGRVRFLIHQAPLPLYPILDRLGYRHAIHLLADGSYEILIERD